MHRLVVLTVLAAVIITLPFFSHAQQADPGLLAFDRSDYAGARRLLTPRAEQGDAEAQFILGVIYYNGSVVVPDAGRAAEWFRKAADQGHVRAQASLGYLYLEGIGTPKDEARGIALLREAAERGHPSAHYHLGRAYEEGLGVPRDFAAALDWYRKGAALGERQAQRDLGLLTMDGLAGPKDLEAGARLIQAAAERNDQKAQCALANLYDAGRGVPKDLRTAEAWFLICLTGPEPMEDKRLAAMATRFVGSAANPASRAETVNRMRELQIQPIAADAPKDPISAALVRRDFAYALQHLPPLAEQGDRWAQSNLGWLYFAGEGTPKDREAALRWFRASAAQGYGQAEMVLGFIEPDGVASTGWYRKAADHGENSAQFVLGDRYALGEGGLSVDPEAAHGWWLKSAAQGHSEAQYRLANQYATGTGTARNVAEAVRWARESARQGEARAALLLGQLLIEGGEGVPKDPYQAYLWLAVVADGKSSARPAAAKARDEAAGQLKRAQIDEAKPEISSLKRRVVRKPKGAPRPPGD